MGVGAPIVWREHEVGDRHQFIERPALLGTVNEVEGGGIDCEHGAWSVRRSEEGGGDSWRGGDHVEA
jgi:hypothetical protein